MPRAFETLAKHLVVSDGRCDVGSVRDFYFDVEHWAIRYLVAEFLPPLAGRKGLISPMAVTAADWNRRRITTNLTLSRLRLAPAVNWNEPLSRRDERAFNRHFRHPAYWLRPGIWAGAANPAELARTACPDVGHADAVDRGASNLRSAEEIAGYRVVTSERLIGHVSDFAFDDDTWIIRYLVVDSGTAVGRQRVLVAPEWAETISWHYSAIRLHAISDPIAADLEPDDRSRDSPPVAGAVRVRHERVRTAGPSEDVRPARLRAIRWHRENRR
jgi:hypothetical protein